MNSYFLEMEEAFLLERDPMKLSVFENSRVSLESVFKLQFQ